MGPAIFDYNMRLILLSVIRLSGGHCITIFIDPYKFDDKFQILQLDLKKTYILLTTKNTVKLGYNNLGYNENSVTTNTRL
jgi:hypothetical protein